MRAGLLRKLKLVIHIQSDYHVNPPRLFGRPPYQPPPTCPPDNPLPLQQNCPVCLSRTMCKSGIEKTAKLAKEAGGAPVTSEVMVR